MFVILDQKTQDEKLDKFIEKYAAKSLRDTRDLISDIENESVIYVYFVETPEVLFQLGIAWGLNKKIRVLNELEEKAEKSIHSFLRMWNTVSG